MFFYIGIFLFIFNHLSALYSMCVSKWITQKNIIVIFNRKARMVEKSNFHFFFLHSANTPFSIPAVKLNSLQRRFTSFKGFCVTVKKTS